MKTLKRHLSTRLKKKGLMENEIPLFVSDIVNSLQRRPSLNGPEINRRLRLLGWRCDADNTTLALVTASHETDPL